VFIVPGVTGNDENMPCRQHGNTWDVANPCPLIFGRRFSWHTKKGELKLIRMNEVEATEISWLWYLYIPYGKITVIQGDPGDEKKRWYWL